MKGTTTLPGPDKSSEIQSSHLSNVALEIDHIDVAGWDLPLGSRNDAQRWIISSLSASCGQYPRR